MDRLVEHERFFAAFVVTNEGEAGYSGSYPPG
jgi:hypothetical protein